MKTQVTAEVKYPQVGVCGLSCRLCPRYHTQTKSRCGGCKTESRMAAGCPFITCALKKRGIEFCWQCEDHGSCGRWRTRREHGKHRDSFVCYRALEANIAFVQQYGVERLEEAEKVREQLLAIMLRDFNDGRSKTYYCIAATVLTVGQLRDALDTAEQQSAGCEAREGVRLLHAVLDEMAAGEGVPLKLRGWH